MERRNISGGQLVGSRLQMPLICSKIYPHLPQGASEVVLANGPKSLSCVYLAEYIIHRATSFDLLTSSCFALGVTHL